MQESRTFTMRYSNHIVDETTHAFKCAKWFALVSSLLLGIFGTVLLIWPNTSMNVICTLLGVLMVVFGVSKIVGLLFVNYLNLTYLFSYNINTHLFPIRNNPRTRSPLSSVISRGMPIWSHWK